jgi:hypothetical protein
MTCADINRHVPHVRPHNRLREGKVYFMISTRPAADLSVDDQCLYHDIDGVKTVEDLESFLVPCQGGRAKPVLKQSSLTRSEIISFVLPIAH